MKEKRKFRKILLVSYLLAFISVFASTAYAQEILWIEYDDFETVSNSNNLWQLGVRNMCSDENPYFESGKMFQEAAAAWYDPNCSLDSAMFNRVRSRAIPLAAPYITGIGARVTLDTCMNYTNPGSSPNTVRNRLGAIFYNDGTLSNSGDGTDLTSEVFAGLDIRSSEVRWYVARLKDKNGVVADTIAWGQLFLTTYIYPPRPDLTTIPFDLKVWFDGTKVYFSAETERATGEIIKTESTYAPVGQILPPKSPPAIILESMIDMPYPFFPALSDHSYIKTEWDDVWVAVDATNLGAVKQIINKASKGN